VNRFIPSTSGNLARFKHIEIKAESEFSMCIMNKNLLPELQIPQSECHVIRNTSHKFAVMWGAFEFSNCVSMAFEFHEGKIHVPKIPMLNSSVNRSSNYLVPLVFVPIESENFIGVCFYRL
jgi:hypothetical protein